MSSSPDDDMEIDIESIHCGINCDNTTDDGGYYSQESSDTPPSPSDEIPNPILSQISHSSADSQFEEGADDESNDEFSFQDENDVSNVTKGIAFVIVHEKPAEKIRSEQIRNIVQTVNDLTQMMRNDMSNHFDDFERNLESGIARTHLGRDNGSSGRGAYLQKAHDQLIKKVVGDNPSWRSFANVINCTNLVLRVAGKLLKENQLNLETLKQLKNTIENQLVKIAEEKFKSFIHEMGGFIDIIDYFNQVKKNRENESAVGTSGSTSFFTKVTLAAGGVALFATLFTKH